MTAEQQKKVAAATGSSDLQPEAGFLQRASTARFLPFAVYMAFIAVADGLAYVGLGSEELRWLYPVKIGLVLMVLLAYRHHYTELARMRMSWRQACEAIVAGVVVLVLWVNLDAAWMQVGTSAGFMPTTASGEIDWLLVTLRIFGAAVVVPVMEELFWRSFLLRWITNPAFLAVYPARASLTAIAVTAVLFGFEHNLWLAGIVAGLAYTWLYMRSGNLWVPVLAHAVTNAALGVWIVATSSWTYW